MLEQMSPWEYQEIRVVLGHGSGFDSPGFRAVAEVTRRAGRAFGRLFGRRPRAGRALPARTGVRGPYQAAEALTDWDERIFVWRFRHYATVARSIGEDTTGTQGTPVAVLGKLIAQRQLPDLWKARATLVERFDAGKAGEARVGARLERGRARDREREGARERGSRARGRETVSERERESETPRPEETDGRRFD